MMATLPTTTEARKAICEITKAFGLDPGKTRSITLRMATDAIVTVQAEVYVETGQLQAMADILKRFQVVPMEEPPEDAA
jgi:hypothetical protein